MVTRAMILVVFFKFFDKVSRWSLWVSGKGDPASIPAPIATVSGKNGSGARYWHPFL